MTTFDSKFETYVEALCAAAGPAARAIATASDELRQAALESAALAIEAAAADILAANEKDLARSTEFNLSDSMIDRLRLDEQRLAGVVADLRGVKNQIDPVGRVLEEREINDGIQLQKVSVPIGVIAIIFESRPNVTVDAAALCVRSGNACILRGGKEAVFTNNAFANAFRQGLSDAGLPADAVQLVQEQDRALVPVLLSRDDAINLVIPRGGETLIQAVVDCSKVPVVKHDKGVCSIYVDADADLAMAEQLILNAKSQRPGVCNAIENILIDKAIAETAVPKIVRALQAADVEVRGDATVQQFADVIAATEADWETEYLALIVSIACVDGVNGAIAFTNTHGSQHSDSIITENKDAADLYLRSVDSACVYHNASTRYTDGSQFGLGAEVGISTNRLHARGPMGINELCTYKFVLRGNGQARS